MKSMEFLKKCSIKTATFCRRARLRQTLKILQRIEKTEYTFLETELNINIRKTHFVNYLISYFSFN